MAAVATVLAALMAGGSTAAAVEVEPGVEWTTIVRQRPAERINVLTVDPARVRGVLSNERIALRERVLNETRIRFGEGVVTSAEYVDRETDALNARLARATHRVELARARAHFLTLTGVEVR